MAILKTGLIILIFLYIIDRLGLWMENRGWIYWRKKPPSGGLLQNGFQELNATFRPSIRHVVEIDQNKDVKLNREAGSDD